MGDWEEYCSSSGKPLNWEPWNEPGWANDYSSSLESSINGRKSYKELEHFLVKAKNSLRLREVKIYFRGKQSKNGIVIFFPKFNVSIKYTFRYYKDRTFEDVKENALVAFILYRCGINLTKRFDLKSENENIDFKDVVTLKEAGEIYIKHINNNLIINPWLLGL
ncbi:TPA: hypothetical protein ACSP3W_004208 [Aeromonas veronii]